MRSTCHASERALLIRVSQRSECRRKLIPSTLVCVRRANTSERVLLRYERLGGPSTHERWYQ